MLNCFRPLTGNEFKNKFRSDKLWQLRCRKVFVPSRGMSLKTSRKRRCLELFKKERFRPLTGNEFKNN